MKVVLRWLIQRKTSSAISRKYLISGEYGYSGMFLFLPDVYLSELNRFAPKIADSVGKAASFTADLGFQRPVADALTACPSDSIDYAILSVALTLLLFLLI